MRSASVYRLQFLGSCLSYLIREGYTGEKMDSILLGDADSIFAAMRHSTSDFHKIERRACRGELRLSRYATERQALSVTLAPKTSYMKQDRALYITK